jgi:hypothetical protein
MAAARQIPDSKIKHGGTRVGEMEIGALHPVIARKPREYLNENTFIEQTYDPKGNLKSEYQYHDDTGYSKRYKKEIDIGEMLPLEDLFQGGQQTYRGHYLKGDLFQGGQQAYRGIT